MAENNANPAHTLKPDIAAITLVLIRQWNVRNGFPFADSSIDAIHMTVSMHHVTQYASDISDLFMHAKRILKTGAVLHLGVGNVDMKYSDRKISRLNLTGQTLRKIQ